MYTNNNCIAEGKLAQLPSGNVADFWKNWASIIAVNDGKRNFSLKTKDCHDQQAPFNENQETIVELTHEDHDISQMQDGFLTLTLRLQGRLSGIDSGFDDEKNLVKFFVGFKSSNQVFDRGQFLLDGKSIGYNQNELTREGFAYANLKGYAEKKTRKFIHSLYENVSNVSTSVCGVYLNVNDFKDGLNHEFTMKLNIPFTDLLALQAFREFPNSTVGQLAFKGYFSHQGMVYTFINPSTVKDYKEILQGESTNVDVIDATTSANFDHKFIQVGVTSHGIGYCKYVQTNTEDVEITKMVTGPTNVTFDISSLQVIELKSNMAGYSVIESTKATIRSVFSNGVIIPSQQLDYATFPIPPGSGGINSTNNIPVSNLSCLSIMFPRMIKITQFSRILCTTTFK